MEQWILSLPISVEQLISLLFLGGIAAAILACLCLITSVALETSLPVAKARQLLSSKPMPKPQPEKVSSMPPLELLDETQKKKPLVVSSIPDEAQFFLGKIRTNTLMPGWHSSNEPEPEEDSLLLPAT